MAFIQLVEPAEAQGELKTIYEAIQQSRGRVAPPFKAVSLHPQALQALEALNRAVTFGGSTLGRRREELIATLVSRLNDCDY